MIIEMLVILVALTVMFLASSLRLKFRFDDDIKFAESGFMIFAGQYDHSSKAIKIKLAGLTIKTIDITKTDLISKVPVIKKAKEEKPKNKRKKKPSFLKFKLDYIKWAFQLLRKIRIKYLDFDISGGFDDPYYTGNTTAIYWMAKGIAPGFMSHIVFNPNFSADTFVYKGKGLITLKMYYIVKLILRLLTDIIETRIRNIFISKSEGVSYG